MLTKRKRGSSFILLDNVLGSGLWRNGGGAKASEKFNVLCSVLFSTVQRRRSIFSTGLCWSVLVSFTVPASVSIYDLVFS
jgi:hypothetical protein